MKFQLFASQPAKSTIDAVYGAIVAQARLPVFYLTYGVPDTVEGRFDMIVLHLVLLFRRLAREPKEVRSLAQGVFDRFCRDMDHNLREMGVGDLSVPKEMQRLGEAFYGRADVYERALAAGEEGAPMLITALARNVLGENVLAELGPPSRHARHLAAYVLEAMQQLEASEAQMIVRGQNCFPLPDAIPQGAEV
jgi:cytochrome b pre-mRNA-processing protein 3